MTWLAIIKSVQDYRNFIIFRLDMPQFRF